ncbi:hypothetical protein ACI8AC_07605 [Geodermatophilus sp. SYSU D00758]
MSDRLTWESCPACGDLAAVGWADETVVEVDCASGCDLTSEHVAELQDRLTPPR